MSIYGFRFRVGVSLVLGLIWTSAAVGDGPLFAPAVHYAAGVYPMSVAIGDLDGDQVPDLTVGNIGTYPAHNDGSVSVLLNQSELPGDLDCNGIVDEFDIDPFVLAVVDVPEYYRQYPDCDHMLGDIDGDGDVDAFDIDPFVELLVGP